MKAPFIFRPSIKLFLAAMLAAMFPARNVEGQPKKTAPHRAKHCISKHERKRREHIRRINPHRTH